MANLAEFDEDILGFLREVNASIYQLSDLKNRLPFTHHFFSSK